MAFLVVPSLGSAMGCPLHVVTILMRLQGLIVGMVEDVENVLSFSNTMVTLGIFALPLRFSHLLPLVIFLQYVDVMCGVNELANY